MNIVKHSRTTYFIAGYYRDKFLSEEQLVSHILVRIKDLLPERSKMFITDDDYNDLISELAINAILVYVQYMGKYDDDELLDKPNRIISLINKMRNSSSEYHDTLITNKKSESLFDINANVSSPH